MRTGSFNVWAIESVDEEIEILTGVQAGGLRPDGTFPEETINGRIDRRMDQMAETARRFQRPGGDAAGDPSESAG